MKFVIAVVTGLVGLAAAIPQGVTAVITPTGAAPAGCTPASDGKFEVAIVNLAKRELAPPVEKRSCTGDDSILLVSLQNGILTDAKGRTGYIASNYQFQFDLPPQAGALITAGFSICGNGSLALGSSTTFYQCQSGSFYNLYDRHWAAQCSPVNINVMPCGSTGSVGQIPDGQIIGTTTVATTMVTVLSDGQPQVVPTSVAIPLCQIGDGQVQAHTTPCASLPPPTQTAQPVSQISDGQIQVPPPSSAAPPPPAPTGATTTPAGPPAPKPTASGSASVSVPAVTTSAPSPPASITKPAASASTSAPPSSVGAANMASGSVVALIVGVVGALFWL